MNICIIGSGYVGLVSAACFSEMGNHVTCVDVNIDIIKKLRQGIVHIFEPGLDNMIHSSYADGRLKFTTSLKDALKDAELAFICVGTPSDEDGSCDLNYVEQVAGQIGQLMEKPLIVVDKSTVPVGTADKVKQIIEAEFAKRNVSIDFDVVSNPEFLKEGDAISDFMRPDRVIIGTDSEHAKMVMTDLYAPFARSKDKIIVMGVRSAEMTKYAANCMLATKISFINEIANICEQVGADVREVRTGIGSDTRIGYQFIYPGVGYGGSCFPKDVKALIHTARKAGIIPKLLDAVEEVNMHQKKSMALKIMDYYESQGGIKGKTLAIWGLSFKANTDDIREAAPISIIKELTAKGMKIRAYDPIATDNAKKVLGDNPLVSFVTEQYQACEQADALLVVTEWNQFRIPSFKRIKELLSAPVIFDGRNLYQPQRMIERGFTYFCIGRKN